MALTSPSQMVIRNAFFSFSWLVSKLFRFGIWCLFDSKKQFFVLELLYFFSRKKKKTCLLHVLKTRFWFSLFWRCISSKTFCLCLCVSVLGVFFAICTKRWFLFWKTVFFMIMFNCIFLKLRRRFCFSCFWRFFLFGLPFFSLVFIHLDKGVYLAFYGKSVFLLTTVAHPPSPTPPPLPFYLSL